MSLTTTATAKGPLPANFQFRNGTSDGRTTDEDESGSEEDEEEDEEEWEYEESYTYTEWYPPDFWKVRLIISPSLNFLLTSYFLLTSVVNLPSLTFPMTTVFRPSCPEMTLWWSLMSLWLASLSL